jgi:hypothetical protein
MVDFIEDHKWDDLCFILENPSLVGGWFPPSAKWWSESQLGWFSIPKMMEKIIHSCSKPPTSSTSIGSSMAGPSPNAPTPRGLVSGFALSSKAAKVEPWNPSWDGRRPKRGGQRNVLPQRCWWNLRWNLWWNLGWNLRWNVA